jgi:hypothetical protein
VLVCILIVAVLSYVRRWQGTKTPVTIGKAVRNVIVGAIPLGMVTSVLILGYNQ